MEHEKHRPVAFAPGNTMSTAPTFEPTETESLSQYRALSAHAVASFVLGMMSPLAFFGLLFVVICVLGILCGIYAQMKIASRRMELTGSGLAAAGIALSATCLLGSVGYAMYVYRTEVPEGFSRIFYSQLEPEPGEVVPASAKERTGEKVFIKGYIFPDSRKNGIKTFLLCRDKEQCCFGGNPIITDRIQVTLSDPHRLTFTDRMVKVWGKFRFEAVNNSVGDTQGGVFYHIDDAEWTR